MNILIIGGTGVISAAVSRLLVELGHEVYLLNRGRQLDRVPEGAYILTADIADEARVASILPSVEFDCVADFIAYVPEHVERDFRLFSGRTRQYIFISSASAYQKPSNSVRVTESTPLSNPFWQYSRDKIACEDLLMRLYHEKNFPATIVRPSHTYDERKVPTGVHGAHGSWSVVKRIIEGKPVIVQGDGESLWTMTHSSDFARAFAGIVGNHRTKGLAVQITSDESLTWNQIYRCMADAVGQPLKACYAASDFLAELGPYDLRGGLLGDKAVSVIFDNSRLLSLVPDFKAQKPFAEGVRETIDYILLHPEYQIADPDFDVWCDKVVALTAAMRSQWQ
jgi:nucleoside-diphosphate-sugar epimerase